MKKLFITAMLAASVGTAPALLILVLVDLVVVRLTNMPSSMMSLGFMGAPLFFPFVVIGTILSCRSSVMIRMRPLLITLGILSVAVTGLVSAYWCYILTHGFMG
jgi:hypothetical protein